MYRQWGILKRRIDMFIFQHFALLFCERHGVFIDHIRIDHGASYKFTICTKFWGEAKNLNAPCENNKIYSGQISGQFKILIQ
jgi:hypothetical protein